MIKSLADVGKQSIVYQGSTGRMFFFCYRFSELLFGTQGSPAAGQLIVYVNPHYFLFITVFIMIYMFILDDSLTRMRLTEKLFKFLNHCGSGGLGYEHHVNKIKTDIL